MVVDPKTFQWTDRAWSRPPFRDLVIYELHVATFTPESSFRGVIGRLPYLRELGVNAIEIMPVADFLGRHNWGYDGVRLYAPARAYGQPDDLRALVDAAHAHGLAVILDVVYNHFGPDGNFLREFSPDYFESRHHTPWGEAINFSSSPEVRAYYKANVIYWMEEFHIDGFRLDATHTIFDDSKLHILAELGIPRSFTRAAATSSPRTSATSRNSFRRPKTAGMAWTRCGRTIFTTSVDAAPLNRGFDVCAGTLRGANCTNWPMPCRTAGCIRRPGRRASRDSTPPVATCRRSGSSFAFQNHDQCGNRAYGERLNHFISPETYRAASALLCLIPYTPLLFMGQEWGASTPFLYFTDHHAELGRLVEEGRRRDLLKFPIFEKELTLRDFPSPQARETFEQSKLRWDEAEQKGHGACLRLYREALRLRREHSAFRPRDREHTQVAELSCEVMAIRARAAGEDWLLLCDLRGGHRGDLRAEAFCALEGSLQWRCVLSSNGAESWRSGCRGFRHHHWRI